VLLCDQNVSLKPLSQKELGGQKRESEELKSFRLPHTIIYTIKEVGSIRDNMEQISSD
jgi:hypothetical protein